MLDLGVAICDIKGMKKLNAYIKRNSTAPMREIAEKLGVSRPYLYDLIKGEREPSITVAVKIANATGGEVAVSDWPNLAKIADAIRSSEAAA